MLQIKIIIFEFTFIFPILSQSAKWVEEKYGRLLLEPGINIITHKLGHSASANNYKLIFVLLITIFVKV